ncbi:MAG TPA: universal stress protein [Longimicrobiales bacterium]
MRRWRSIVVPLDGSLVAEAALPLAAELAQRAGAILHLLHLPGPAPLVPIWGVADTAQLESAHAYVAGLVSTLGQPPPPCLTAVAPAGDPVHGVVAYASAADADFVVLASHGHGAFGRAWIGSFAQELLPSLPIPLLVVRPEASSPVAAPGFRNIAVLLDGSERAEAVLDPATRLGDVFHARYALIRVVAGDARAAAEARDYLEEVAQVLRGRGLDAATLVLRGTNVAASAASFAWSAGADLVALATRGEERAPGRGSIAQELLRLGGAPLLSLRAAEE